MSEIHYSIQPKIVGRPDKTKEDPNPKRYYKQGFHSRFTTVEEFAKAVAEDGYLWSGTQYKSGLRETGSFVLADTLALDIDNDGTGEITTSQEVLENHPLAAGICLIYSSGSSTPEVPRFRVVFRLEKPVRDRREFRILAAKFLAVSNAYFSHLDPIKDESRVWYGSHSGADYINANGVVDLDVLNKEFAQLPEEVRLEAEHGAIRTVASRDELIRLGLLSEKDAFAGDPETDKAIFVHCLKHLPKWEAEGWYEEGKRFLGAAVESFGVDVAAEVLEAAWGEWPRDHKKSLFDELRQWERNHGNPAGFGSVVEAAKSSKTWTADDQDKLDELQKEGIKRRTFNDKHADVLGLDSVRELFGIQNIDTEESLAPVVQKLSFKDKANSVLKGLTEIVRDNKDNRLHMPLARDLNNMLGNPFDTKELSRHVHKALSDLRESNREGLKPLLGAASIFDAVDADEENAGYLIDRVIGHGCTLIGGPPKVGKTSMILAFLIQAFYGRTPSGFYADNFAHLTIFSDDQKAAVTGRYLTAALKGVGMTKDDVVKAGKQLNIYPSLTLDADGIDRLSAIAENTPGGVFVVDSLTSCSTKMGYDENSSDSSRIIYDLREAIESVDPTATILIIHHTKKDSPNDSKVNGFRGSGAITGAVDNLLSLGKPMVMKGNKWVHEDLTNDRTLYLTGRGIQETEIVISAAFNYVQKPTSKAGRTRDVLDTITIEGLGTSAEYNEQRARDEEAKAKGVKTRGEALSDGNFAVYNFIGQRRNPVPQMEIEGSKSSVSRAVKELSREPFPLIQSVEVDGKTCWERHPNANENFRSPFDLN